MPYKSEVNKIHTELTERLESAHKRKLNHRLKLLMLIKAQLDRKQTILGSKNCQEPVNLNIMRVKTKIKVMMNLIK